MLKKPCPSYWTDVLACPNGWTDWTSFSKCLDSRVQVLRQASPSSWAAWTRFPNALTTLYNWLDSLNKLVQMLGKLGQVPPSAWTTLSKQLNSLYKLLQVLGQLRQDCLNAWTTLSKWVNSLFKCLETNSKSAKKPTYYRVKPGVDSNSLAMQSMPPMLIGLHNSDTRNLSPVYQIETPETRGVKAPPASDKG